MKNIVIFLLFLQSCSTNSQSEITILPMVNKSDSTILLKIKNNTDSNYIVEFPSLDNFYYKDEWQASTPEMIYVKKSFVLLKNDVDDNLNKNINCETLQDLMNIKDQVPLKFIKQNSEKTYILKIINYRSGQTILFDDDNFNFVQNLINEDRRKFINSIKNQNCNGYKYFTGNFIFVPTEIVLP